MKILMLFTFCCLICVALPLYLHHTESQKSKEIELATSFHKILYIDSSFSLEQKTLIKIAAIEWQNKTKGVVQFTFGEFPNEQNLFDVTKSIFIYNITVYNPYLMELDAYTINEGIHQVGFTNMSHRIPHINLVSARLLNKESFRMTVLHELGHAMGLQHNEEQMTVMSKSVENMANHITDKDYKNFCQLYLCSQK